MWYNGVERHIRFSYIRFHFYFFSYYFYSYFFSACLAHHALRLFSWLATLELMPVIKEVVPIAHKPIRMRKPTGQ